MDRCLSKAESVGMGAFSSLPIVMVSGGNRSVECRFSLGIPPTSYRGAKVPEGAQGNRGARGVDGHGKSTLESTPQFP